MSEAYVHNHEHTGKGLMCSHVAERTRPLTEVWHLSDGTWDFLCGENDHSWDQEDDLVEIPDIHVVCADCVASMLQQEFGLPPMARGMAANLCQSSGTWTTREMTDEELAEENEPN